jgi:hypothetical protein
MLVQQRGENSSWGKENCFVKKIKQGLGSHLARMIGEDPSSKWHVAIKILYRTIAILVSK